MTNTYEAKSPRGIDVLNLGQGTMEFILDIEGVPYRFCSNERLEKISIGSEKPFLSGLQRQGLNINYSIDLQNAYLDGSGITFTIKDNIRQDATRVFCKQPTKVTQLWANIGPTDDTIQVASIDGFNAGEIVYIGTEAIRIGNVQDTPSPGAPEFTDCERGLLEIVDGLGLGIALGKGHFADGAGTGGGGQPTKITDFPESLIGRRVALLGVPATWDESAASFLPTVLWRGSIKSNPGLTNLGDWTLPCDSITEKLKLDIFNKLGDEFGLRGIVHPEFRPLDIVIREIEEVYEDVTFNSSRTHVGDHQIRVTSTLGFASNKVEWLDHLNAQLAAAIATTGDWNTTPQFVYGLNGDLQLRFLLWEDPVTPLTHQFLEMFQMNGLSRRVEGSPGAGIAADGNGVGNLINGLGYVPFERFNPSGPLRTLLEPIPLATKFYFTGTDDTVNIRDCFDLLQRIQRRNDFVSFLTQDDEGAVAVPYPEVVNILGCRDTDSGPIFPARRTPDDERSIYISNFDELPGNITAVSFDLSARVLTSTGEGVPNVIEVRDFPVIMNVDRIDTSTGKLTLDTSTVFTGIRGYFGVITDRTVKGSTVLGSDVTLQLSTETPKGSVVDFLKSIIAFSPLSSSLGVFPEINELDIAVNSSLTYNNIEDVFSASFIPSGLPLEADPYYTQRLYQFFQDYKIEEILSGELKILNQIPGIDPVTKRLIFFPNTIPNKYTVEPGSLFTISSSTNISRGATGGPFSYNRQAEKFFNQLELKGGLNPKEDEYSTNITTLYYPSISRYGGKKNILKIEPKSKESVPPGAAEWQNIANRLSANLFSIFGFSRNVYKGYIPMSAFNLVQPGSIIAVTLNQLPNTLGYRSAEPVQYGIVKSVDWNLDQGYGQVEVTLGSGNVDTGYSPALKINNWTTVGSGTITFTVDEDLYSRGSTYVEGTTPITDTWFFEVGDRVELRQFNSWNPFRYNGAVLSKTSTGVVVDFDGVLPGGLNLSGSHIGFESHTGSYTENMSNFSYVYSGSILGPAIEIPGRNLFGP